MWIGASSKLKSCNKFLMYFNACFDNLGTMYLMPNISESIIIIRMMFDLSPRAGRGDEACTIIIKKEIQWN